MTIQTYLICPSKELNVMISINMSAKRKDEKYWGFTEKDGPDHFGLIDTTSEPEELAKEIVDNIEKATGYILSASKLIEESNDEVVVKVKSVSNVDHSRMPVETLTLIIAAYITNLKGYGSRNKHGSIELAFRTEYTFLDTLYGIIDSIIEHSNYRPEWYEHMRFNSLPIAGSNEVEGNFRIAVAVANMLNVIGWERMRDATGESGEWLDKYGTIDVKDMK